MDSIEALRVLRKYFPTARIRIEAAVVDDRVGGVADQRLEWGVCVTRLDAPSYAACCHADLGAAVGAILVKSGHALAAAAV